MKTTITILAAALISFNAAAEKPVKSAAEKPVKAAKTAPVVVAPVLAPTAEVTAAVQDIQEAARECYGKFGADKIVADLKMKYAQQNNARVDKKYMPDLSKKFEQDLEDAKAGQQKVYTDLAECRTAALAKINASSKFIVSEFAARNLRDLGVDFIVQTQTVLNTASDEHQGAIEFQKMRTMRARIDLELSMK